MSLPDGIPEEIIQAARALGVREFVPVAPGFSGAQVVRGIVGNELGDVAIKGWPSGTRLARVHQIHQLLIRAANHGCRHIPTVLPCSSDATTVVRAGRIWEMLTWLSGQPLPADASLESIALGAQAIRHFHDAARGGSWEFSRHCATFDSRRELANRVNERVPLLLSRAVPSRLSFPIREALSRARDRLCGCWKSVYPEIQDRIRRYVGQTHALGWVMRDVHREHVLFHDGVVSGLIDFDAVRMDTPAADLSRWGGCFVLHHDPADVWEHTVAGYGHDWPLESGVKTANLLADLHYVSAWISMANWVIWLLDEHRHFAASDHALAARIEHCCRLTEQTN